MDWKPPQGKFGEFTHEDDWRIKVWEFRKNMGLSQLELAKSIGVSRQTINMIENNKYNPTLELCLNLAKALDTDLNSLFWDGNSE